MGQIFGANMKRPFLVFPVKDFGIEQAVLIPLLWQLSYRLRSLTSLIKLLRDVLTNSV